MSLRQSPGHFQVRTTTMKIKETRTIPGVGRLGPSTETRIVEVDVAPEGAIIVDDKTPVTDWVKENN